MIRFSRLVYVFALVGLVGTTIVSCSTMEGGSDSMADDMSAIDDDGGKVASDDQAPDGLEAPTETASTDAATPGSEDELEGEFDKADSVAASDAATADAATNPPADAAPSDGELDDVPSAGDQAAEDVPPADDLSGDIAAATDAPPAEAPPAEVPVAAAPTGEKAQVKDIRYVANQAGGTVVIETSKPVTYQTRLNAETHQFVIELADVELPQNLQRPMLTKDAGSKIGSVNAYQGEGSTTARVVIQLNGADQSEPVVSQEGGSLVVIPPAGGTAVAGNTMTAEPAPEGAPKGKALAARTLDEFLTGNQTFYGRPISLQVKDADVRDVVNFLAEESGANVVMSDDVKGQISLKLRRVPWDQALVTVMRTKDLGYVRQGNVLRISTLKALQGETEAANKILEAQKAIAPAVVQAIPISYASTDELLKNLKPFLSKEGQIVADNRSQTIVVTDKNDVVERIEKLVKTLDIPPAQVSIESKIVEALESFSKFAGVNWGASGSQVSLSPSGGANGAPLALSANANAKSITDSYLGTGPLTAGITLGTLDVFGDLTATLSLAETDQIAKVISSPRISSMNREKSTIVQKSENVSIIATRSETTGIVTKNPQRTPFSLELSVTPQITVDGSVIMDLDVKREFLGPVIDQETQAQAINSRQAKTKILVRNGQTAVIGGIYTSDENESKTGIPGLMNVPVLGWLFKNRTQTRSKTELLIFLTPRILANETAVATAAKPADPASADL